MYGPDLLLDVFQLGQNLGIRHYLLGSTLDVVADLKRELLRRFPRAQIVGSESPPFRQLTKPEQAEQRVRIVDSEADIVWLGLGTPKQDLTCADLARHLPVVVVAVGAAFDFVSGHKNQAPLWMRRHGLEWAFRLASEPRRLWRRYLIGNVQFLRAALRGL